MREFYIVQFYIHYTFIFCNERNHTCGSSKHARICLVCKMRSGREKRAIGKIELASSRSWIVFDISTLVNYHIVRLTQMWHFGMITQVLPECTGGSIVWVSVTYDMRRAWIQDRWGRLLRKRKRNIYQVIRTAAEAHWQTRLYMKDYIKPGYLQNHKKKLIPRVLFCCQGGIPSPHFFQAISAISPWWRYA